MRPIKSYLEKFGVSHTPIFHLEGCGQTGRAQSGKEVVYLKSFKPTLTFVQEPLGTSNSCLQDFFLRQNCQRTNLKHFSNKFMSFSQGNTTHGLGERRASHAVQPTPRILGRSEFHPALEATWKRHDWPEGGIQERSRFRFQGSGKQATAELESCDWRVSVSLTGEELPSSGLIDINRPLMIFLNCPKAGC